MIHSKKGQVYIFVAVLLIAFAFTVARPPVPPQPRSDAFRELHENFALEGSNVVNGALYDSANVSARFADFAGSYFTYSRNRVSTFRFLYILRDGDAMVVGNKLGLSVNVSLTSTSHNLSHDSVLTAAPQDVTVDMEGIKYDFGISSEQYQVKSLFRMKTDTEKRIFINK